MKVFWMILPKRWFSMIRTKIAAVLSLLIGLISLFIFISFPARLEKQATKAIAAKAQSIVEMIAFSISPALFFADDESMDEILKGARRNKDLVYIVVLDGLGRVVTAFNKDEADQSGFARTQDGKHISRDDAIYRITAPILSNNRKIGQLYLGFSLEELRAEIAKSRRDIALVSMVIFAIGMAAAFIISTVTTKPLSKMVETVEQISRGDLTQRAVISSQDEVGNLARSFNLMVDNLGSAYSRLGNANRSLKKRIEELNMLLYTMSHDLKAPAVSLQGFSSLLIQEYADRLDEHGRMYLGRIQANSERMGNLIERLLELFRIGRAKGREELVDISDLIHNVIHEFESELEEDEIRIVVKNGMPTVKCDRSMMGSVFANLISNASKYMGEDNQNPVIEIGYEDQNGYHRFYVKDNGIGIDEKYHEKIFQILQRLNDIEAEGTGVGLTIVKRTVESFGGEVWVDSAKGYGTTMYFTMPKDKGGLTDEDDRYTVS